LPLLNELVFVRQISRCFCSYFAFLGAHALDADDSVPENSLAITTAGRLPAVLDESTRGHAYGVGAGVGFGATLVALQVVSSSKRTRVTSHLLPYVIAGNGGLI
jgi:hypothetical protein